MDSAIKQFAKQVIQTESSAVGMMVEAIGEDFDRAVRLIADCPSSVVTSGVGKAGHIARKISATFASTGTPSHFLSPADAVHGDLGGLRKGDVVVIFSSSGESDEILRLLSIVKKLNHAVIAITATKTNGLGKHADATIVMGKIEEACPLGLAPSASTTAMLALGDALALCVMKVKNFTSEEFAVFHPAGQIGRKLTKVKEAMTFKLGENLAIASDTLTVGEVLQSASKIKRRSGAVILTNGSGAVSGIFSDGDLRRIVTSDKDALTRKIADVMTHNPKRISAESLASQAMAVMNQYRIDELPVVDDDDKPVGLIDVQDLVVLKMLDVDAEQ